MGSGGVEIYVKRFAYEIALFRLRAGKDLLLPRTLRGCLGFDLERVQARNELLRDGGVDELVALDCRLGVCLARWKREVEKRYGNRNNDNKRETDERVGEKLSGC